MSIPPSSPPERCQDEAAGAGAGARAVVPDRLAWCLWGAFALLIAAVKFADPPVLGDVFTIYHDAACRWLAGQPLYNGEGTEFIYLPQSAVLWTPFALLPYAIGGALLRVLNVAAFAIGVRGLARLGSDELAGVRFLCVSVPAILMSWSSARAGQMTLAMGGMMMLALAALAAQRWWRAALWLTVGLALKPLIVVLTLLVVALARPTRWPLLVATLLLLALPFLAQASPYVLDQYLQCIHGIGSAAELGVTVRFPQLFGMLDLAGIHTPETVQTIVRLLAAALTLAAAVHAHRRCRSGEAAILLYALAVGYLLLFSPRTENNTYSLLAPALGMWWLAAVAQRRRRRAWSLTALVLLFVTSNPLCTLAGMEHGMSIKPLLCAAFLVLVLRDLRHGTVTDGPRRPG